MGVGYQMIVVALAGAAGTLSRWGMSVFVQKWCEKFLPASPALGAHAFPVGTLAVNVLGCLLFGVVFGRFEHHSPINNEVRLALLTGFMGAFTTFSTFAFETQRMHEAEGFTMAGLNILLQVALGLLAVAVGLRMGKALI